ncbi:hypothetical protein SAMN05444164_6270 [Bradyrhizobium erythrophlei]|uniref:Membrane protein involved in the export of O-antigen and teichoic acid n=2 Tax=Bradyrhizobium erythrophlei TaxID=1437360 RepID=A0A1H5EKI9_9BRAD|nr:hypothetical protein SAMN05444164_6270 [Bradyrhizobium erythrophlei]
MKSIIISASSAGACRILAIVLNLVGIPLALAKLGPSRFGLLLVILSISSWIGFANIGMGRVIANTVARRSSSSSRFTVEFVSLATVLAAVINLLLFLVATGLFFLFLSFAPLEDVIAANYHEFAVTIVIMFFALSLWFFLSVFEGIDAGHHQLHRLYFFQLISYSLSLAILLLVFPTHPSITFAAYLLNLGFLLGSVFHAVDVVRRNRNLFSLNFGWRWRTIRLLTLSSLDFTVISLGLGVIFQFATGLFGFIDGPESVVELGIFMRLMQSYGSLVIAFTFPLSNLVAFRLKRRDVASVVRTVRLSGIMLLSGSIVGGAGFLILGVPILSFWLKSAIHIDRLFLVSGSLLIVLGALHFFLAALMTGAADIRTASRIHILEAVAFLPLAFLLFRALEQSGVLLAMDIVLGAGTLAMLGRLRKHSVLGRVFAVRSAYAPIA